MCGIVYYNNKKGLNVSELVRGAYKKQRGRGHQGFGFFTPETNKLTHNTKESKILKLLKRTKESEILFHHRFPTSTNNVRNACHPFSTKNTYKHNYVMVHNGVLYNEIEVAKKQRSRNIKYISMQNDGSFNDSEVLMYDIADVIEGNKSDMECEGSIAFVMVQLDESGNRKALYFGRNHGNPLKLKKYKTGFSLTSEGDGYNIDTNTLYRYDYKTNEFTKSKLEIPYMSYSYNYYGSYTPTKYKSNETYFTETTLDDYAKDIYSGYDTELASREVQRSLMYDSSYNNEKAIELGETLLDKIMIDYYKLEYIIEDGYHEASVQDVDDYLGLEVKIELLNRAINIIRGNLLVLDMYKEKQLTL